MNPHQKYLARVLRPLLGGLDDFPRIVASAGVVDLHATDLLFREGDPGDALYVLVHGRLRIERETPEGPRLLATVRPGDVVGEFAVLRPGPRSATVIADRDSQLVRITREEFDAWAKLDPGLAYALATKLVTRVQAEAVTSSRARVVTLVPHRSPEPLRHLVERLPSMLRKQGRVVMLTSQWFDQRYGEHARADTPVDHPDNARLLEVLGQLELKSTVLVLVTDPSDSEWTRRCLRQADRLVVVAEAGENEACGAIEASIAQHAPDRPVELLLLHPHDTERPTGTARWLAPGRFVRHHHARYRDEAQLRSLARRLAGRGIGLVLSGGGARGFAHLGVWRALEEDAVHVDHLGGTSMGALLSALFAHGMGYAATCDACAELTRPSRLFDYTLPLTSLFRSRKLNLTLEQLFGDVQIEDLWTPWFCTGTNLTTAERVLITQGPLRSAVRISISIPGVFAPVVQDGCTLVDGGVMDNFPVDAMRHEVGSDRIIGVNVAPPHLSLRDYAMTDELSGWWVMSQRLHPFRKAPRVPSLMATLMRSLEVNSAQASLRQQERAELLLEPSVKSVGILQFHRYQEAADIGYEVAKSEVGLWASDNAPTELATRAEDLPSLPLGRLVSHSDPRFVVRQT